MYHESLKLQNFNNLIVCDDQPRHNDFLFRHELNRLSFHATHIHVIVLKIFVLSFQFSLQFPIFFNANCFSTRPRVPCVKGPKGLCYEFCSEFVLVLIAWPMCISEAFDEMGQPLPPDYLHWANAMTDFPYYFTYH